MYPIIFKIYLPINIPIFGNELTIYTFGVLAALGFIALFITAFIRAKSYNINKEKLSDIIFYSAILGIIGARLNYVLVNLSEFEDNWIDIFKIYNGGLVFYGGIIFGIITGILLCRKFQIEIRDALDCIAPGLAIGHFFGRLGCFSFGCCYGKICDASSIFAVQFPEPAPAFIKHRVLNIISVYDKFSAPVYATQLMEAIFLIILALFLFFYDKKFKKKNGELFVLYILFY
ncbi:MAG TPA: prolipoprotein diacylglyceryl transferase, partial [bacterium]|nr:prolipoprotein diacylglyceryl transferase [bacterium]